MAPKEVAETAYKALMSGERVIIPGVMNKALVFGRRFLPESGQARMNEKMYEEVPAEKQKRERGDIESKSEHPNRES
jgi:short-subunit dehydrogenase